MTQSSSEPRPLFVRTTAGTLRGGQENGVAVFRGIPFAEPPVGALRFAAPRPVRGWEGVRPALDFGPPPPQGMGAAQDTQGDVWLTVNVWTPEPDPGAGRAVMVWIHGGAYMIGTSGLPEYDGSRLAGEGDVVVVTFNYRAGMEGFAQIEGAPANRGLLDQVAALEWVRDNIQAFGGDPGRVTVFGESAGAGSVAALLAMPGATGLFRRAVAQSVQGTFFTPELAADIASVCASELGLRPTAAELSSVDPLVLAAAGYAVTTRLPELVERWGPVAYRSITFAPVVDGHSLPVTPWQALAGGAGRGIDLLVGHTRDEHRLLSLLDGLLGQVTPEQAEQALRILAHRVRTARAATARAFPARAPTSCTKRSTRTGCSACRASTSPGAPRRRRPGVRLRADLARPGMGGILGACHGLDVPLVFGNLDRGQPAALIGDGPFPEAEALSAQMRAAWTRFAVDGDPGWPAYDSEQRLAQIYDAQPKVAPYPAETSRLVWRHHTFAPLTPLSSSSGSTARPESEPASPAR
ncbi:carboxylesterase family protein [Acrocarpospora sp. B8E8]|uniref:carboxylesterase/lipase family protein n=1 Tax=Acrocarpospora sp. B8E8 TaxID=3153572 RepID=UPI00325E4583